MAKTLYVDCFSGASGDMMLGALLDAGLPLDALRGALGSLAIEYGEVTAERVSARGRDGDQVRRRSSRPHEPPATCHGEPAARRTARAPII